MESVGKWYRNFCRGPYRLVVIGVAVWSFLFDCTGVEALQQVETQFISPSSTFKSSGEDRELAKDSISAGSINLWMARALEGNYNTLELKNIAEFLRYSRSYLEGIEKLDGIYVVYKRSKNSPRIIWHYFRNEKRARTIHYRRIASSQYKEIFRERVTEAQYLTARRFSEESRPMPPKETLEDLIANFGGRCTVREYSHATGFSQAVAFKSLTLLARLGVVEAQEGKYRDSYKVIDSIACNERLRIKVTGILAQYRKSRDIKRIRSAVEWAMSGDPVEVARRMSKAVVANKEDVYPAPSPQALARRTGPAPMELDYSLMEAQRMVFGQSGNLHNAPARGPPVGDLPLEFYCSIEDVADVIKASSCERYRKDSLDFTECAIFRVTREMTAYRVFDPNASIAGRWLATEKENVATPKEAIIRSYLRRPHCGIFDWAIFRCNVILPPGCLVMFGGVKNGYGNQIRRIDIDDIKDEDPRLVESRREESQPIYLADTIEEWDMPDVPDLRNIVDALVKTKFDDLSIYDKPGRWVPPKGPLPPKCLTRK